ncbi:MAG: DegT/DnrJ/EryC1/StrS aminotransferase [Microgenomates group bacterium GW2011_GWC1_43_11]|nr:MAG: DegT/DnrJ/EryC1/StrS aminotransferase [Microgenomates group bacterium GW2011_GWC1_43_11]
MIPVAKPHITAGDAKAVSAVVLSGWIIQGPKVEEFEKRVAGYVGVRYAVATSSATTAMHLGFIACGIGKGDEVIVPSMSFIASPNSIVHAGATPVFADINERTYNVDPEDVERNITKKTKAILAVHQIGLPADMEALTRIAKKYDLMVFEDAACGLGAKIGNAYVGSFGTWSAFSFHPRKTVTTGEGGILVTNNQEIAEKVRMLRQHGASVSVYSRHTDKGIGRESYPIIGYNFRMSDIHAALGISQFRRINSLLKSRQNLAKRYDEALSGQPNIIIPYVPPGYTHTYQSYMIRLPGSGGKIRNKVMQHLLKHGIATRAGVMSAHLEKPYKTMYPNLRLPVTERVSRETLILPLYAQMRQKEQDCVIDQLKKALG